MNIVLGNTYSDLAIPRKQAFALFVRRQQQYYSLYNDSLDDFLIRLLEGESEVNKILECGNICISNITIRKKNTLSELIGNFYEIVQVVSISLKGLKLSRNWFHDGLFQIDELKAPEAINAESFRNKIPEFLKEGNFQIEQGLDYLKSAIGNPDFSREAIQHFIYAKQLLDQKRIHDPYLYYCIGLCYLYFNFSYAEAISLFTQAIYHSKRKKNNELLISRCYYELGKLYYLEGKEDLSLKCFHEAVIHDQKFVEAKFQQLKMMVLTSVNNNEVTLLLDEIVEFNNSYILKIIAEKELRDNEVVIAWLVNISKLKANALCEALYELKEKHSKIFDRGLYASEFHEIEEILFSEKYFSLLLGIDKTLLLDTVIQKEIDRSQEKLKYLESEYSNYKRKTWGGNLPLLQLAEHIESLKCKFNERGLISNGDENFDFTYVKEEYKKRDKVIREIYERYGVNIIATQKNEVLKSLKNGLFEKRIQKMKESVFPEVDKICTDIATLIGLGGVCLLIYYMYKNWGQIEILSYVRSHSGYFEIIIYIFVAILGFWLYVLTAIGLSWIILLIIRMLSLSFSYIALKTFTFYKKSEFSKMVKALDG